MLRWLSDYDGRRDNNFTLIRIILAWSVLFGHSFAITKSGSDPITPFLPGAWTGAVAVDGFFAISGFLVAASFVKRGAVEFVLARVLRIYPALVVCTVLTILILGPVFTTRTLDAYFSSPLIEQYWHNALLWPRVYWYLPGVFEDHPDRAINGSLWTLPVEVRCYFALLIVGLFGALRIRLIGSAVAVLIFLLGIFAFEWFPLVGFNPRYARPCSYFLVGVLIWLNREYIPLHWTLALAAVVLPYVARQFLIICLPYILFFCAYALPHINADKVGDCSYGLYIYAWPCQQIAFWHGQSPYINAAIATLLAAIAATLSWFIIERPALKLRAPLVGLWHRSTGKDNIRITGQDVHRPAAGGETIRDRIERNA